MGLRDAIKDRVKSGVKNVKARVERERAMNSVLKETREEETYKQKLQYERDKVKDEYSHKRAQNKERQKSGGSGFGGFVFGSPAPVKEVAKKGSRRRSSSSVDAESREGSFSMDGYLNGPRETRGSSNPFNMGDYIHGSGGSVGVGQDMFSSGSDVSGFLHGKRSRR
jgi:hypothetical protein